MDELDRYDLYLFDFDGLLVNTEFLHYRAYILLLEDCGLTLDWSFVEFCNKAHGGASTVREALYAQFPHLNPDWSYLYGKKKGFYLSLLEQGSVQLMPGVAFLLEELNKQEKRTVVVTHSSLDLVLRLSDLLPQLQTIQHWVTREQYVDPKPAPDGYLQAIALYGQKGDRMIGFEDSYRGAMALVQAQVKAVLVAPLDYGLASSLIEAGVTHIPSLEHWVDSGHGLRRVLGEGR